MILLIVSFLSGVGAMVFQTSWFHVAGIIFGNSVWSVMTILSAFMGGLALGSLLITKYSSQLRSLTWIYFIIEITIAISGFCVVLFAETINSGFVLLINLNLVQSIDNLSVGLLRGICAFGILILPTTAMGATLPILVKLANRNLKRYVRSLGMLYSMNTFGAVTGAIANEEFLIYKFGLIGATLFASICNCLAGILILRIKGENILLKLQDKPLHVKTGYPRKRVIWNGWNIYLAAFLSGGALLGLEVLWFRFLLLYHNGTSSVFCWMLVVVLCGIAIGGLIASNTRQSGSGLASIAALFSGILISVCYSNFDNFTQIIPNNSNVAVNLIFHSVFLMMPISILSGILYTQMGKVIYEEISESISATGILTFFNTLGAMSGAILAGLVLLPTLGMERTFYIFVIIYGMIALLCLKNSTYRITRKLQLIHIVGFVYFTALLVFPFGNMEGNYFKRTGEIIDGAKRIATKEGLNETVHCYEQKFQNKRTYYRLVTNCYSMSSTDVRSRRYMKLFAYLPFTMRENYEEALLICYGVGSTAKAMVEQARVRNVDIVDLSEAILEMSKYIYPKLSSNPLDNEKTNVFIDDGRFYLKNTSKKYNLITSEPPPLKIAGVVNLYTKEYFNLIRDCLTQEGIVTYWLPVYQLKEHEAKAIIRSFIDVFHNTTLWEGGGLNWILVGSKSSETFVNPDLIRQFCENTEEPMELKTLGFEAPEQLASTFIGGPDFLGRLSKEAKPLTDNYPRRLSSRIEERSPRSQLYRDIVNAGACFARFQEYAISKGTWRVEEIEKMKKYFEYQAMLNYALYPEHARGNGLPYRDLHHLLTETQLETLPGFMLGVSSRELEIVETHSESKNLDPEIRFLRVINFLVRRDYELAQKELTGLIHVGHYFRNKKVDQLDVLLLMITHQTDKCRRRLVELRVLHGIDSEWMEFEEWIQEKLAEQQ